MTATVISLESFRAKRIATQVGDSLKPVAEAEEAFYEAVRQVHREFPMVSPATTRRVMTAYGDFMLAFMGNK